METTKVIAWVDIQAPLQEVYETVLNVERRMQLSPLWGSTTLEGVDPDYPEIGSAVHFKLVAPPHTVYRATITALESLALLAYRLTVARGTRVTWRFQKVSAGTRLTYEEVFTVETEEREVFEQAVRKTIQDWLLNFKRYGELRQGKWQGLLKWLLDRYYLPMRPDQRKAVQIILYMNIVGMLASTVAIIAWGIAFGLK